MYCSKDLAWQELVVPRTEFGLALRKIRVDRKVKLLELEKKAGLSQVAIGDWERGKRHPRRDNLELVMDVLDLRPDERETLLRLAGFAMKDQLLSVADDVDGAPLLAALANVVDVGANLERLTPDTEEGEPFSFGGPIRVMRIRHDCMRPKLNPGDIVFITPPETVKDGDIVIAAIDVFHRSCKRVRTPADAPSYLEPINGEGTIPEGRFTILGVVKYRLQPVADI